MLLRLSVRMLRSSSPGQSSSAMAIPVSSGRSDDGGPKTATLRAGRRSSLATSDPSVATTMPLRVYAAPSDPSSASREEGHVRSQARGTTPSAIRRMESARSFNISNWSASSRIAALSALLASTLCAIRAAVLAQMTQSSLLCTGLSRPDLKLSLLAAKQ